MRFAAVIIAGLLLAQTVSAAGDSAWGPGSFFYPMKIWMEKFSLNFIFNQTEKDMRILELADERLKEAENMGNNSKGFERAMEEYTNQLGEVQDILKKDANDTGNIRTSIREKIEEHRNRTKMLNRADISIIQQNIVEASSSSGDSNIRVSVVNGNVSVHTEGGNATVTRDGGNVTVISVTNNSRQVVIVNSSTNQSSSSSSVVVSSSSSVVQSVNR